VLHAFDEEIGIAGQHRDVELRLALEVAVDRPLGDPGDVRDLVEVRRLEGPRLEYSLGRVAQTSSLPS
jgi:hypothetical protein